MKESSDRSRIYLIRHGRTKELEEGKAYGSLDVPVSELGYKELDEYKNKYVYININAKNFVTSGMLRTKQTLQYIFDEGDSYVIQELAERHYGAYEGKVVDMSNINSVFYMAWTDTEIDNDDPLLNGMESLKFFRARVLSGFNKLWEKHMMSSGDTVAILHHGIIVNIMSALFPECKVSNIKPGRGFEIRVIGSKVIGYSEV